MSDDNESDNESDSGSDSGIVHPRCTCCEGTKRPIQRGRHNGPIGPNNTITIGDECKCDYNTCERCWAEIYINGLNRCPPDNIECGSWLSQFMQEPNMSRRLDGRVLTRPVFNEALHGVGPDIGGNLQRNRLEDRRDIARNRTHHLINDIIEMSMANGEIYGENVGSNDIRCLNLSNNQITNDILICIYYNFIGTTRLIMNDCDIDFFDDVDHNLESVICIESRRSRYGSFDDIMILFPRLQMIDISSVMGVTNLDVLLTSCRAISCIVARNTDIGFGFDDVQPSESVKYIDVRGNERVHADVQEYADRFPNLLVFKYSGPQNLNIARHTLTADEEQILVKYTDEPYITNIDGDHILYDRNEFDPKAMLYIEKMNITDETEGEIVTMMRFIALGFYPRVKILSIEHLTQADANIIRYLNFPNINELVIGEGDVSDMRIDNFYFLEMFYIHDNPLQVFPYIGDMEELREIYINDCGLTLTDESPVILLFQGYDDELRLRILDLTDNNIQSSLPFRDYGDYIDIRLDGNPIDDDN
jgi:hypothetical protein